MLDIITNNPFRVLGIFGTSKQADIIRNVSKMKAYLNVGREISFPSDLDFILPKLNRSVELTQQAQSQINLPADKIHYALFWFCADSSMNEIALNNLAGGDIEKALGIFDRKESYAALLNKGVIALIQDRIGDAVTAYSTLLHSAAYRQELVKAVCDDTVQFSEDTLSHYVLDEFLKVESAINLRSYLVNADDVAYVSQKALAEPMAKINAEIAKAKAASPTDADASLRAGKALMRNTKTSLSLVKRLAGATSIEFQSVSDNLAKQILQCGINYYNHSSDDNSIENALALQQYALNIAVGKLTKDRCKQNVDILLKKKEQAAYEADLAAIALELQSFQSATPSIYRARQLVNTCKPHLDVLKRELGYNNDLYLKISSAIANNALGMVIDVVNKAQDSSVIRLNILSGDLGKTLDSAVSAMDLIGQLDMNSQERSRFNTNKSTLFSIKSQLDVAQAQSSYTPNYSSGTYRSSPSSSSSSDTNWGCIIPIIICVIFAIIGAIAG